MFKYVKIHAEPCRFRSYFARQVAEPSPFHHPKASQHRPRGQDEVPRAAQQRGGALEHRRHGAEGALGPPQPRRRVRLGEAEEDRRRGQHRQGTQGHQQLQETGA